MQALLGGLLLLAAGGAPGLLLSDWLLSAQPVAERRIAGIGTGVALTITCAFLAAALGHLEWTLAFLGLIALFAVAARRRWPVQQDGSAWPAYRTACILAVGGAWLWFAVPVLLRGLPSGWDPGFHVSIVELIRTDGVLPETWAPYEPAERFDYPPALHAAMALLARLGGLSATQAYNATFLALGLILLAEVWVIGTRTGGHPLAGALGVLVLGFTDGWGTLTSQADWGGIANVAGLVLIFGLIIATFEPTRRSIVLATIFAIAAAFEHHLTFAILMFVVAFLALLEFVSERRLSPPIRSAATATAIALGTAGVSVLLRSTGRFRLADALRYGGEPVVTLPRLIEYLGVPMLVLGTLGLIASLRRERDPARRLAACWAIGLLAFWATFDLVYRAGANLIIHQNWSAFTPTRGLTNAALFLAIAAGAGIWRVLEAKAWRAWVVPALGLLLIGANASAEVARVHKANVERPQADELRELCDAIREKTPDTSVLYQGEAPGFRVWLPYLCERETNYFPDPGYLISSVYRQEKMRASNPLAFAKYVRSVAPRPVYYVTTAERAVPLPLIWHGPHWKLYEVPP